MYLRLERLGILIFHSGIKTVYPHCVKKRVGACLFIYIKHNAYAVWQYESAVVRDHRILQEQYLDWSSGEHLALHDNSNYVPGLIISTRLTVSLYKFFLLLLSTLAACFFYD